MTTARKPWRVWGPAVVLGAAFVGTACGPERPPAPGAYASAQPAAAAGRKDLPASAYQLEWSPVPVPATLKPGERVEVPVTVKNTSTTPWPANGRGELYVVRLSHRWLKPRGAVVADFADRRAEVPGVVNPGGSVTVSAALVAPTQPGKYVVQFDLVHEGVAWFADRGAAKSFTEVKVK